MSEDVVMRIIFGFKKVELKGGRRMTRNVEVYNSY
jgi:hypothetical protein